jgi:hypothetical protein
MGRMLVVMVRRNECRMGVSGFDRGREKGLWDQREKKQCQEPYAPSFLPLAWMTSWPQCSTTTRSAQMTTPRLILAHSAQLLYHRESFGVIFNTLEIYSYPFFLSQNYLTLGDND